MLSPELITRVVNLIQKNGDKVVLADPATGKAVVVLDLDAYEKLTSVTAPETVQTAAPAFVPAAPKFALREVENKPEISQNLPKKKAIKMGAEMMNTTHVMADLTQEELIDKINRDIGAWKNAQLSRRSDELKSVALEMPRFEAASALEDEERFYLEPIE